MREPRILVWDIETTPLKVYSWSAYGQNWSAIKVIEDWYVLCFAYKWLGDKKVTVKTLRDYKGYDPKKPNDKALMQDLWDLLDEADITIAHNGDKFDLKKVNRRFLDHKMGPPSPSRSIDTLKAIRRFSSGTSNRLDSIGEELGLGRKVKHEGFELWEKCMAGDKTGWKNMIKYNKQDVALLEAVYLELRPWMSNHPNLGVFLESEDTCPACMSQDLNKEGTRETQTGIYQRYSCNDCGKWSQGEKLEAVKPNRKPI